MIFFKHHEDKITINDQVIDFFVFLKLEPDYEMPTKAKTVTYIPDFYVSIVDEVKHGSRSLSIQRNLGGPCQ